MIIESSVERNVMTIDEHATALDAAELMKKHYIGSLIVTGKMGFRGLFTERDLMMDVVGERRDPASTMLADIVRENYARVTPQDSAEHCLDLMKEHRCRHLLVFDAEDFVGLVSLRDMVVILLEEKEQLISRLKEYISA
ncbi:MAG: CBS domain-containing protein [Mariprofundaceae bacterium]|nr:CBS domain-containing protein [Mariprofundaceae bacterium]